MNSDTKFEVYQLFPNYVYVADLDVDLSDELAVAIHLSETTPSMTAHTIDRGWESHLLKKGTFPESMAAIQNATKGVRELITSATKTDCILSPNEGWLNVDWHMTHVPWHRHPKSIMASVLYLSAPEKCGALQIKRPDLAHDYTGQNGSPELWPTKFDIEAKPNRLVIFPAWLEHSVINNAHEGKRVSLAMNWNFLPKGHPSNLFDE